MARVNEYLTIAAAARVVGVAQNTLRQWAESGKVPVRRNPANGYRLFRRQDLEAFLSSIESGAQQKKKPAR
jgi:excisionase family DNA binding protein